MYEERTDLGLIVWPLVYTALVAPSKPKKELVTDHPADGPSDHPTDGRTHPHIESLRCD